MYDSHATSHFDLQLDDRKVPSTQTTPLMLFEFPLSTQTQALKLSFQFDRLRLFAQVKTVVRFEHGNDINYTRCSSVPARTINVRTSHLISALIYSRSPFPSRKKKHALLSPNYDFKSHN